MADSAPWEDYAASGSGPWSDYAQTPQAAPQQPRGLMGWLKDTVTQEAPYFASAGIRPVAKAAFAMPNMIGDAATALYNYGRRGVELAAGQQPTPYAELPSAGFNRALDQYTTAPTSAGGKIGEAINTGIVGMMMPGYKPESSVPDNFVPPDIAAKQPALAAAQKQGYVVPPSQTNPTFANRLLEGISGKLKLNQEAMQANQPITTRLASQALGQNPDAPLTQGALSAIRQDAVQSGYAPLRNLGTITPTPAYGEALDKIVQATQGASRSFPGIKAPDVAGIVEPLRQSQFEAKDAIDAISVLRGQADEAYAGGQKTAGAAYKAAAKALEDAIEQHLKDQGGDGNGMLSAFRDARTLIAKSINVGKALNEGTGQVSATKLAQQAARGAPLTGELRDIATFAQAYPKVSREVTDIFPSISPLDAYGSAMAAASSHSAAPLMIPLSRVGIREYLLSGAGQARAVPQMPSNGNASLGVLNLIPASYAGLSGLAK